MKKVFSKYFKYFHLPVITDKGIPLETALAKQDKSGITFKSFCAPPIEYLKPVTTSSNIKRHLFLSQRSLTFVKKLFWQNFLHVFKH